MSRRRIAFYMHDLSGGGVEKMRLALIAELISRNVEVVLILGTRTGELAKTLPFDFPVVDLGKTGMLPSVMPLARVLRRVAPDVLVASLDHNNVTAILARLISGVSTRVVICQHNALSSEGILGWRYRAVPWLYWLLQGRVDAIIAVSNGVGDDLASVAGIARERITTIYNPVVGADFVNRANGCAPHPWLRETSQPTFVFAGRLTPQKDPVTALRALALLPEQCRARLLILGDGPMRAQLELEASRLGLGERVAFAGFQVNPLVWMRSAAGLVCSSRYEGFGNSIVEALACGTPVISTDCPHGPSEILMNGQYGQLAPVGDPAGLANAMQRCINAPDDSARLVARAACFSTAACADAHEVLFDRLLARGEKVRALGMQISPERANEVVDRILGQPARERVQLVVTPNLDHVRLLRQAEFRQAYQAADIVCPDGLPVLLYARLRGLKLSSRVTGCDIFSLLARDARVSTQRLFLVLESKQTARAVAAWAAHRSLDNRVFCYVAPRGLLTNQVAQQSMISAIRAVNPTILIITLGAPQSEILVHRHRNELPPCWALCVGQAVRVEVGLTMRAPSFWQRLGLEWAWRARQEPRRLIVRYVQALAWFPVAVLNDVWPWTRGQS